MALAILLILSAARLSAQPEPPHPILTITGSGSGASTILSTWTESQYTNDFVPHQAPRSDASGFAPAVVSGDTGWSWTTSNPNQIQSVPSGIMFPTNTTYAIHTQAVSVLSGNTVQVPYYYKSGSTSSKSLVFAVIDLHKRDQLRSDFNKLAPAYINSGSSPATRNDTYARRIAIALMDWARWYPDYFMTPGWNQVSFLDVTTNYVFTQDNQRASDHNGLAHEWEDDELMAFDAIYDSVALTNLIAEMGFDVRGYISSNIFFFEGDMIVRRVPVSVAILSNLPRPYEVLPMVARVLNRPDYMIWEGQYLDATIRQKIRRDGALEEGEGYSIGYLNGNVTATQNTLDYFLTRAATNAALLAVSNNAFAYQKVLQYGQGQWNSVSLPTGQLPSFGDTPFNNYFSSHSAGNSALLPAYGHVTMGAGSGSQAVQVNQNFPGNNNHMRSDVTAYVLWAFNNEILGNIRYYNGTAGRNFDEQILAHNAVTIDRVNMTPYPDADTYGNGDLTLYEPGNNGLAMTEIDGQRDYSGKASRYQRLLFLNSADLARPYLVDVFRVTGGTNHDYTFHGAIRWDQTWQCSFPLTTNPAPYPMLEGETWVEPTGQYDTFPYYGFWRQVSSNQAPGNFQITYRDTSSSHRDARLWMTDDGTAKVYLGITPNPGRDNTVPPNFYVYWRPSAIIRKRTTSGTLQDLFVSVIEPMNAGVGTVQSVDRLPVTGSNLESCALKITFTDGRTDTYLVNLRNLQVAGASGGAATVSTADGKYSLTGRVGVHMDTPNGDSRVWTVNSTDFQYPGRRLTTPNTYYSGLIAGETRKATGGSNDAFTTTTPLPVGTALRNKFLSLTHGALSGSGTTGISEMFKIHQIILSNGLYYVCFTNDHVLEITNGTTSVEQMAPLRTFTGSNALEIALSAFAGQISPLADVNIPPGGSSGAIAFSFGNLGNAVGSSLQVLASSSNQSLVPNGNLLIGGSGTNRTITITPTAGQTGLALITISVTDGVWTNSRSFNAVVSDFALTAAPASQSVLVGASTSFNATVIATNGFAGTVTFGVSGVPGNASASFNPPSISGAGSSTLNVATSNSISPGTYTLTLSAGSGGRSSSTTVALVVSAIVASPGAMTWNIGVSAASSNWSAALNWTNTTAGGYGPPGAANDVIFGSTGSAGTSNTVNNIVDSDTTVASLAYSQANGYHTTLILPGKTLAITNGLSVGTETDNGTTQIVSAVITGPGATLNLTGGNLTVRQGTDGSSGGTQRAILDMSGLDTFTATISRAIIGSEGTYARETGTLYLPRTNILTASGSSPAIAVGGASGSSGNAGGISQILLGRTNALFTGSIAVGRGKQSSSGGVASSIRFNPIWTNVNPLLGPVAYFRATDGVSRIASWSLADSGSGGGTVNTAGAADFIGGLVDAAIGTLTIAKGSTGSGSGNPSGTFTFNAGTVDVNTLQVGYQGTTNSNNGSNFATGTMNINGGTLVVNTNLQLALTAGGSGAINTVGILNLNGGTVQTVNVTNAGAGTAMVNINSGTLDLRPDWAAAGGSIWNISTLNVGAAGVSGLAVLTNAASISTTNTITIASNGVFAGNTVITAPKVIVSGALLPGGNGPGWFTNTGVVVLGGGGNYYWDIQDATGLPGSAWDVVQAAGNLDVQASSANPFTIRAQTSGEILPGSLPHFDNTLQFDWLIASAAALTNFAPEKFKVNSDLFADDLAGGFFHVTTNSGGLVLSFANNHAPVASDATYYLSGPLVQIPIAALVPHWSDPDGDPVMLLSVSGSSANGTNNVSSDNSFIYYTNSGSGPDTIIYTVADIRTNPPAVYRPGDTVRTGIGLIQILLLPVITGIRVSGSNLSISGVNGSSGAPYYLLSSTNMALPLSSWTVVATNSFDTNGNFILTNAISPDSPSRFYLLQVAP